MSNKHGTLTELFGDIANVLREKLGTDESIVADDFPEKIMEIASTNHKGNEEPVHVRDAQSLHDALLANNDVILDCDIDCSMVSHEYYEWEPIGNKQDGIYYSGTIYGGNYKIYNLVSDALISYAKGTTIKNLTLMQCGLEGVNAAALIAYAEGNTAITACTVIDNNIFGSNAAGAIIGLIGEDATVSIRNCTIHGNNFYGNHTGIVAGAAEPGSIGYISRITTYDYVKSGNGTHLIDADGNILVGDADNDWLVLSVG